MVENFQYLRLRLLTIAAQLFPCFYLMSAALTKYTGI